MKIKLKKHEKALKEEVFFTTNRWPHFNLLFDDIKKLSKKKINKIICIERTNLYGAISLFKPFFSDKEFISVDCSPTKILKRAHIIKNLLALIKL